MLCSWQADSSTPMRWQSAGTVLQAHLRLCFEQFEMNEVRLEPIAINIFFGVIFRQDIFFSQGHAMEEQLQALEVPKGPGSSGA